MIPFLERLLEPKNNGLEAAMLLTSLLDVNISRSSMKRAIEEHPDYPSLLSVGDVLNNYGIANIAAKFSSDKLGDIPVPFITLIKSEVYQTDFFTVVKEVNDNSVTYADPESHRWISINRDSFTEKYDGIVLLTEIKEDAGEKGYQQRRKEERGMAVRLCLVAACIPAFILITGLMAVIRFGYAALLPFLFSVLALGGSIIGALLLWYELDQYNPVLQQICTRGQKTNCGAVLQSKGAKLFGINWSVIGFTWFSGNLFYLLVSGITTPGTLWLLSLLNLPAACYIFYSLYYQWRVIGQWCVLCLGVQTILALQCIITYTGNWHSLFPISHLSPEILLQVAIAFAIPFMAVTLLLPAMARVKEGKKYKTELFRLKNNLHVFEALLAKQKNITEYPEGLGIVLGNPQAANKIIKVCNPYCGPCSVAHPVLDDLLDNNPDVQLQIIFTATNEKNDRQTPPVRHLMTIAGKKNEAATREALDDWYMADKKDYEIFASRHPMDSEIEQQNGQIEAMIAWCYKTGIRHTPTFFINGQQLPENYNMTDLKYFLSV